MDHVELNRILNNIAQRYITTKTPAYFDCMEALDALEFHVLDFMNEYSASDELRAIRDEAMRLHAQLTAIAQATMDNLIHDIRSQQLTAPALRQIFNHYAHSVADQTNTNKPDYDLFDDFLSDLCRINYEPSETRSRTREMFYLQPTPGRIILDMINAVPFTKADCFYDLGSGLGCVPILVSLLTDAYAIGIEYEPTYVHYSRCAAQKLGLVDIDFRNMDVQDADLSEGTVFFMYTPFTGSILRNVLNQLYDLSRKRPLTLCTYGPCTRIIERETWLYPLQTAQGEIYRLAIFKSGEFT